MINSPFYIKARGEAKENKIIKNAYIIPFHI